MSVDLQTLLRRAASSTRLDVSSRQVDDQGAALLANYLRSSRIKHLDASLNHIGDAGAMALAAALDGNRYITALDLHDNDIGDGGARALLGSLRGVPTLRTLDLSLNRGVARRTLDSIRGQLERGGREAHGADARATSTLSRTGGWVASTAGPSAAMATRAVPAAAKEAWLRGATPARTQTIGIGGNASVLEKRAQWVGQLFTSRRQISLEQQSRQRAVQRAKQQELLDTVAPIVGGYTTIPVDVVRRAAKALGLRLTPDELEASFSAMGPDKETQEVDVFAFAAWVPVARQAQQARDELGARELFDAVDEDRSGSLDPEEVTQLLSKMKLNLKVRSEPSPIPTPPETSTMSEIPGLRQL